MLPGLFPLALELARHYGIPHLRVTRPEWRSATGLAHLLRNAVLQAMAVASPAPPVGGPQFIGLGRSGRLDLAYLDRLFARLRPGRVYELMCHPGRFNPAEITEPRLLAYHAWEAELALLTGPGLQRLYQQCNIQLVNYRGVSC
jgi:predicted glycoside hydrolase/deacetylase ChbG (UPF0249 family)